MKILEKEEIHLAIIDIMMPVMDGITMTMKLREHYDFPVIMLSAKSEEIDKVTGLNIGADDYVTKPFAPMELMARVNSQLRRYSLNTFAQETNVNTKSRIIDYDIRELGEQLMPLGMLVTLDSIFNRVIQNWKKGKTTWIFADEFYLLFRYEYSADFFYRLYKRIRKYSGFVTGLTQNVEELLKSDTARLMLANSEFLILLNQASTDRDELAALLNISDNQLSYITNVGAGHGLIRCSGNLVPFENSFPRNTKLYRLMTTKPGEA